MVEDPLPVILASGCREALSEVRVIWTVVLSPLDLPSLPVISRTSVLLAPRCAASAGLLTRIRRGISALDCSRHAVNQIGLALLLFAATFCIGTLSSIFWFAVSICSVCSVLPLMITPTG